MTGGQRQQQAAYGEVAARGQCGPRTLGEGCLHGIVCTWLGDEETGGRGGVGAEVGLLFWSEGRHGSVVQDGERVLGVVLDSDDE